MPGAHILVDLGRGPCPTVETLTLTLRLAHDHRDDFLPDQIDVMLLPPEVGQVLRVVRVRMVQVLGRVLGTGKVRHVDLGVGRKGVGVVPRPHHDGEHIVHPGFGNLLADVVPAEGVLQRQVELGVEKEVTGTGTSIVALGAGIMALTVAAAALVMDRDVSAQLVDVGLALGARVAVGHQPGHNAYRLRGEI